MHVVISSNAAKEAPSAILSSLGITSVNIFVCFLAKTTRWCGVIDKEAWVKSAVGRKE